MKQLKVNKPNHSTDVESSLSPISTADSSDSDEGAISPTVRTPLPLVKVMDTWLKNYFPMVEQHVLPMLRSNRKRKHERKSSSKSKTRRHKRRDSSSSSSSSTDSKSTSSESSCSSYDFDSDSSEEEVPPPPKRPKVLPQRRQAQSVTHPVQTATMEHSDVPKSDYVMYIFVNSDLKMTAGKVASQVGHIVHVIVDECVRESYETFPPSPLSLTYQSWNSCCTKIILKATEQELKELLNRKDARGFYDSGRTTQGTNDALTAVGLLPGPPQDDLVAPYKLL